MSTKLLKSLLFFILAISIAYPLNSIELNQLLDNSIKRNNLQSALVAVKIIDSQSNAVILSRNANKNFAPASNTKLLTGVAGLLFLSKDFRFQTKIYYDKINNHSINNLYIEFSGDPSFTRENLHTLLINLQKNDINNIKNIYFVNRYFEGRDTPINQSNTSSIFGYGAPSSIYNLNENAITLQLTPNSNTFKVSQTVGEKFNFINKLFIASPEQLKTCQFNSYYRDNMLVLSGCLPSNSYTFSFAIEDPQRFMQQAILAQLAQLKISLTNKIKTTNKLPNNLILLAKHKSADLTKLLKHMLVTSDNLYAQTITRTIGYYHNQVGSIVSGKNAIIEIIKTKLKVDTDSIQIEDGAGMSENDLLSADFISSLLQKMSQHDNFEVFKSLLPIYGETGTLKNRSSKLLKGKVFAKTGTGTTAVTLSGYLYANNKQYIFSILINNLKNSQKSSAVALERDLLESIC
ncbi:MULTISPECIES: D-alanyl-D-alanine carboxypeptidase/D-alanyl-D-alanine endopeptidase [Francisella]|uniref:D-alanyl-D-alanine carboxypeptidase/D-alanyl-D-alanine-endopeptidase n=1 Tax=Francisella opportunistica TaxID=2016517 RepID=A0A345JS73_9GAMM|nr:MULTISPECIES: D-alanyl-D-alanine carboxypeptidase/D-alanyl-D-alanine-endopeptidase [Francisella]APC91930.1 D-alanyl-D-alanine carboxypeptidase [Francisella sp. MA067296]AXH30169.1 D-alanyl-D-alanine carboxypeptidase/D-alanyl-D-alanine-endopeptidase [Francisella opportunistica]AXH31811.1 D-alanyl-D-alanine carboxypeptidase/D-alanyl-D-alanine-endopeptidase [Francisella opportunistica]AXH33457.1 D-alanyl-D-alanine carboxypeptidase/D-alanyl-D-alanine-endopeptidase [Francisella opportunistica]